MFGALRADNAQGELYLTDIVATAASRGTVGSAEVADLDEMQGVNSRVELGLVERRLRGRLVRAHQEAGASFVDPKRVYVEAQVQLAQDVTIGPDVQLCGSTRIGSGAVIEGPSVLIDTVVQPGARVRAFCHLEGAQVASGAQVGPYARLRPGAELAEDARVGNFVEVKNARLGQGAKANHLAYVGDADVGAGANIGAGTIFANYDGFTKQRTRVGVRAFVGSNSTLVAPLSIGAEAWVAAGSTITRDVPAEALAFGRARQVLQEGQARVLRERLAAAKKAAVLPT